MLEIIQLNDGRTIVERNFKWQNPLTLKWFSVPAGFLTDFVSTKILKMPANCNMAATFHDVDYWFQTKTRLEADIDYKNNLIASKVSKALAWVQFLTLRAFGWAAWNKNAAQREKEGDVNKIITIPSIVDLGVT